VRNRHFIVSLAAIALTAVLMACDAAAAYHKMDKDADVPRISLEDAKKAYDAGKAIIVDARAQVTYDQEHIKGAINIPFGGEPTEEQLAKLPKGKKIIVYCS
jgi:3-mercaptopyruvate sulfurtransferase SseA